MSDKFQSLFDRSRSPQIMVVGDVILDRYRWGNAERISPEAPIPVLAIRKQEDRLGGAGNVAAMLAALGAKAGLAAVTRDDPEARVVGYYGTSNRSPRGDRRSQPSDHAQGAVARQRHQRFPQQMIRVDREDRRPISAELVRCLLATSTVAWRPPI